MTRLTYTQFQLKELISAIWIVRTLRLRTYPTGEISYQSKMRLIRQSDYLLVYVYVYKYGFMYI
jgi:hypothetical protein